MSDVMKSLISMTPVIDLSLVDSAYTEFLLDSNEGQYMFWNTGYYHYCESKDLNDELLRKGVPNNLDCILKVY